MRLERLKFFLTVAETGSFSEAAERLYTTQSAVSKQVIALEKELGVSLFDRSRRRVVLTEAGQIVLSYARSITESCNNMLSVVQAYRRSAGGILSVASIPVMGQYGITELVGRFRKSHPGITMSVGELESSEILTALEQGRYEMAFMRAEQLPDSGYECLPLTHDALAALLPESHPLAGEKQISLSLLKDEPFLLLNEGTLLHKMCVDACQRCGFIPRTAYTGTRNENIAELVAMGMGVSLVMEKFFLHLRPAGVRCIPLEEHITSTIALVRLQKHRPTDAACLFWAYIRDTHFPSENPGCNTPPCGFSLK